MTPKQILFRILSILTVIGAIALIVWVILDIKPYVSKAKKVELLAGSTGLTVPQVEAMTDGCVRTIDPGCIRAPVSTGTYYIVLKQINTIGGKWGGSGLTYSTSLGGVTAVPKKVKNWGSSISQQPSKKADVSVKITLSDITRALHQDYGMYVSMNVVIPHISGSFSFSEKETRLERDLSLYTVTPEEMKLMQNLNVDPWFIVSLIMIVGFILLFAAAFYAYSVDVPPARNVYQRPRPRSR